MVKEERFLPLKTQKVLEIQGLQRNSLYNHADRRVYHQATGKYTLARDEIQQRLCRCW